MAVRTQRTGANPRAKVAHSHTPTSVGDRRCTGSVQTDHSNRKSESGNLFRRSGRGRPKGHAEYETRLGAFPTFHCPDKATRG